jgi:hypothetical protein
MCSQNAAVEFERLLKVRHQVVAGSLHYFTIEAKEGEARKLYKAVLWQRTWEKYRGGSGTSSLSGRPRSTNASGN